MQADQGITAIMSGYEDGVVAAECSSGCAQHIGGICLRAQKPHAIPAFQAVGKRSQREEL